MLGLRSTLRDNNTTLNMKSYVSKLPSSWQSPGAKCVPAVKHIYPSAHSLSPWNCLFSGSNRPGWMFLRLCVALFVWVYPSIAPAPCSPGASSKLADLYQRVQAVWVYRVLGFFSSCFELKRLTIKKHISGLRSGLFWMFRSSNKYVLCMIIVKQ